jgi:hypothetical protein
MVEVVATGVAIEHPVEYPVRMTRRRLILAASFAVVALGAAWGLLSDGLTAEERRLVGTWKYDDWQAKGLTRLAEFHSDGRCFCPTDAAPNGMSCWWSVRGGSILFDCEPSRFRRLWRPVASALGLSVRPVFPPYRVELAGDCMVIYSPDGTLTAYARASE